MRLVAVVLLAALAAGIAAEMPLIQPQELAAQLQKGGRPTLIHVGFNVLYRNKRIPKSIYAGPASTPQGLAALKAAAGAIPRDRDVVVYCGCCPWDACPNMRPAVELLKQMGFTRVKALYIPTSMAKDWFDRGYPAESGAAR
jgi:thiosulfate/3-mercaptopyruvate sulfurtransferase